MRDKSRERPGPSENQARCCVTAYASRALPSEENYAQIEKELLAIVSACEKFDAHIYDRDSVHVQTTSPSSLSSGKNRVYVAPKRL